MTRKNETAGASADIMKLLHYAVCGLALLARPGFAGAEEAAGSLRFDFNPAHVVRPQKDAGPQLFTLAIEKCPAAPRIDGAPDDPCWAAAAELTDFGIPEPPTRARICYDDRALYCFVRCEAQKGRAPRGEPRARDAGMRQDDNIHIVVSPGVGADKEHFFRINPAGSIYDARMGDESWNPEWAQAVQRDSSGWQAEVAIPFAALGLGAPPPSLGFNIGRSGPDLMMRAWYITLHSSAAGSALILKGAGPDTAADAAGAQAVQTSADLTAEGAGLAVVLPRSFARPQDRWIDAVLQLAPGGALKDTRLTASLFALGGREPLATASIVPEHDCGLFSVDLRRHNLADAEVKLEYTIGERRLGLAKMFLTAQAAEILPAGRKIPVQLDLPAGLEPVEGWPVVLGVPFPRGALWDAGKLRLVDDAGAEIPCQKEIVSRWAREGSVQWVRFDALVNSGQGCWVETSASGKVPAQPVSVREAAGQWIIETGAAKYVLARGASPVAEIWSDGRKIAASAGTRGLFVIDQNGQVASAAAEGETVAVEAAGPAAACVRFEGFYRTVDGVNLARHITRVEAFAGQPFARVTHTLVLSEDTRKVWFREAGWEFAVAPGADPRAVFNIDREDSSRVAEQRLAGAASAYMLQGEHERYGAGTNRFVVAAGNQILAEGAECGDWAMLAGEAGGLLAACKEAARQHPKEFEMHADRLAVKLFSSRAGEELEFAPAKLAQKWNLQGDIAAAVNAVETDAAGWSKTHELMLAPLPPTGAVDRAALLARLHSQPVFALVDPEWIHQSGAMGPLHPRDTRRFPAAEKAIEYVFGIWSRFGHEPGHYGFVDYFAGPTYNGSSGPCSAQRYRFTYGLRSSIWLVYARSGDRAARIFAEGSNKAYLDNYLAHWDVPGKVRGIFTASGGKPFAQLPFYWGKGSSFNISSSTDLNQFLWLYYLTGYRRAKDAVAEFGEGLKRGWQPGRRDWRPLMVFRTLTQCYGFTWDPRLRALAEGTFDAFTDGAGELLLTKNRPYNSSSYKTQVDVRGIIEGWRLLGDPKYRRTALALAWHWWHLNVGTFPVNYMNPMGVCGNFLYEETGDPSIPAGLDYAIRRAATLKAPVGASAIASLFESLPYAMDVVARCPPLASWAACNDYGSPVSIAVNKGNNGVVDLTILNPPTELGRQFGLRGIGIVDPWGQDLHRVLERSSGAAAARIPKDAPGGCYEIVPSESGEHFVLAGGPTPMVLHATNYWSLPELAPAGRVYFKVTEDSAEARIFFEGRARLFDPQGQAFGAADGVQGWIDLPADKPGLWSFEPLENRLVRGQNFPPFYAFGRPENYFMPPIAWERAARVEALPAAGPAADAVFVPGAIPESGNQALSLAGRRSFEVAAGPAHPSGDGGQYLPYRSGTIEFFLRPYWATFDLGTGNVQRSFVRILNDKSPWVLLYRLDPEGVLENLAPKDPSHALYGRIMLDTSPQPANLRVWRTQAIFERGEWTHVAWSWGPEINYGPHREKLNLMTMRIFVNGRGRKMVIFRTAADALALGVPHTLVLDPLQGAVDELRISDMQRYREDFVPPARERAFAMDEHTRALFHFDGNLEVQSHGAAAPAAGSLKP